MKRHTLLAGAASGLLLVLAVGIWSIVRAGPRTPREKVFLHIPDGWQQITVIRPAALTGAGGSLPALLDDPLDRAFPAEANNLDETFDVQFPDGVHLRFWTFHHPPAEENIVAQAPPAGDVRGVRTWQHALGRLAMPDPQIVAASPNSDGLQTVVLEGMVRMRPLVTVPPADFVVAYNLKGGNPQFAAARDRLMALSGGDAAGFQDFRRLAISFRFSEPAAVDIALTADSRARADDFKHQFDAGTSERRKKLDQLVASGAVERGTPEYRAFESMIDAQANVDGEVVTVSIKLPVDSLVQMAQLASGGSGKPRTEPATPRRPATEEESQASSPHIRDLDDCLAVLAGDNRLRQMEAARYLEQHPTDSARHAEVIARLIGALERSSRNVDAYLAKALDRTVAESDVPLLIESLQSESAALRRAAIEVLSKFPSDQAARTITAIVARDRSLRVVARESLERMGAVAEPATIALLSDSDRAVRLEACRILKAIGTGASTSALTAALDDRHLARHAREALAAIEQRSTR